MDNIWIFYGYVDTTWIQKPYKNIQILSMKNIQKISKISINYPDIIHGYTGVYPKYPLDTLWIYCGHIVDTQWIFHGYISMDTCVYIHGYILDILWIHGGYFLDTLWIHRGYLFLIRCG